MSAVFKHIREQARQSVVASIKELGDNATEDEIEKRAREIMKTKSGSLFRQSSPVYHDGTWSSEEIKRMAQGRFVDRNGKRYGLCRNCRTVIRVDKPLIGGLHFCE